MYKVYFAVYLSSPTNVIILKIFAQKFVYARKKSLLLHPIGYKIYCVA